MKRSIYLIAFFAFILRFGLGITASTFLPQIGYDSKPQQAGYLFFDAYRRDSQAWDLAQSGKPLSRAFDQKFASDQYGGLLWLSAFIYRYLSAGTHQPPVVVFLAALISSFGVLFVYLTAKRLTDEKIAFLSALVFAFYPEAILLGASQMREPFLMTFIAMAFHGLVEWQTVMRTPKSLRSTPLGPDFGAKPRQNREILDSVKPWIWMGLALAGMLFISPGFVLVTLVASAGWLYFSETGRKIPWQVVAVAAGIFILALVAVAASWNSLVAAKGGGMLGTIGNWARETAKWNAYILGRSSGIVQLLFQALPPFLATPFVAVYGILQPVLPAALVEPSVPFWQIVSIVRSLGWYLLLPVVAFAPFAAWNRPDGQKNGRWLWLSLIVWGWIIIASVRGGGDQWDNPRYRIILLAWIAMLAAQAFYAMKSRWFWRIVAVEAIILLVFGHWYSWRYLNIGFNLGIRNTLAIAIGLAVLVVLVDWLLQRIKRTSRL